MALAGMAGYINSVVLGFFDTPVGHMSGAVSRLGRSVAERHFPQAAASGFIVLGFLAGAMLAGLFLAPCPVLVTHANHDTEKTG